MTKREHMRGAVALASFETAMLLVKQGRYEEALAVPMLESDRVVIQERINVHRDANTMQNKQEK